LAYVIFDRRRWRRAQGALREAARSEGLGACSLPVQPGVLGPILMGPKMLMVGAEDLGRLFERHPGLVEPSDVYAVVAEDDAQHARSRELRCKHLELEWVQVPHALRACREDYLRGRPRGGGRLMASSSYREEKG
jgi:hypothetical protein